MIIGVLAFIAVPFVTAGLIWLVAAPFMAVGRVREGYRLARIQATTIATVEADNQAAPMTPAYAAWLNGDGFKDDFSDPTESMSPAERYHYELVNWASEVAFEIYFGRYDLDAVPAEHRDLVARELHELSQVMRPGGPGDDAEATD